MASTEPIVTSGQMVIPANTNVLIRGTSRDVIHSFWIPRLNGKRDMVPGRVHTLRMQANEPGIYAGQCAEFCGLSHANMRMEVVSLDDGDFESWKANQLEDYEPPLAGSQAATGEATFIANCSRCHQINGLTDGDGVPIVSRPDQQVYPGAAPNLSNLMTRNTFAGASWDLINRATYRDMVVGGVARRNSARCTSKASPTTVSTRSTFANGCATHRPRSRCMRTPNNSKRPMVSTEACHTSH